MAQRRVRLWDVFTDTLLTFTLTENTNKQKSQPWSFHSLPKKKKGGREALQIFWKLKFWRFQSLSYTNFLFVFKESTHIKQFSQVTSVHLSKTSWKAKKGKIEYQILSETTENKHFLSESHFKHLQLVRNIRQICLLQRAAFSGGDRRGQHQGTWNPWGHETHGDMNPTWLTPPVQWWGKPQLWVVLWRCALRTTDPAASPKPGLQVEAHTRGPRGAGPQRCHLPADCLQLSKIPLKHRHLGPR